MFHHQWTVFNVGYFQQPAFLPSKHGGYNMEQHSSSVSCWQQGLSATSGSQSSRLSRNQALPGVTPAITDESVAARRILFSSHIEEI